MGRPATLHWVCRTSRGQFAVFNSTGKRPQRLRVPSKPELLRVASADDAEAAIVELIDSERALMGSDIKPTLIQAYTIQDSLFAV